MATVTERTLLPEAVVSYQRLHALLDEPTVYLSTSGGADHVLLSPDLLRVLTDVVDALNRGDAVSVIPRSTTLTTQEAADLLGISRPTLIKLLNEGEIPYEQPGRHRRVQLRDLLAYKSRLQERRAELLTELVQDALERLDEGPETRLSTR